MKQLGRDYRLFVKNAAPATTYSEPGGQGNLTINRSSSPVNTTDKSTFPYGTQAPGLKTLSVTQAIIPDLPDSAFTRMKALDAASETELYQIRKKPFTDDPDDIVFQCLMYTSFGNSGMNLADAVEVTVELSAAEAPTIDLI